MTRERLTCAVCGHEWFGHTREDGQKPKRCGNPECRSWKWSSKPQPAEAVAPEIAQDLASDDLIPDPVVDAIDEMLRTGRSEIRIRAVPPSDEILYPEHYLDPLLFGQAKTPEGAMPEEIPGILEWVGPPAIPKDLTALNKWAISEAADPEPEDDFVETIQYVRDEDQAVDDNGNPIQKVQKPAKSVPRKPRQKGDPK